MHNSKVQGHQHRVDTLARRALLLPISSLYDLWKVWKNHFACTFSYFHMLMNQILQLYMIEGTFLRSGASENEVKDSLFHAVRQYGIEIVLEAFIGFQNSSTTKSLQSFLYVLRSYKNQ